MSWRDDVRRANETLDWIEARQGPLKPGGYARIETDVRTVRAMAEQDDAQVQEIRARLEAATPGPWLTLKRAPDLGATEIGAQLDTPDARVIADTELWGRKPTEQNVQDAAFIAHSREDVPYLLARLDALTAERDELLIVSRECRESMSRATTAMARDVVTINDLKARLAAAEATMDSPTWPYVLAFARQMEAKLDQNRHKGNREGWLKDAPIDLLARLVEEVVELQHAIDRGWPTDDVAGEAADVANFALMVADAYRHRNGSRAALAGSREQAAATTTTRTITMRCHCGRGVTIGPDPWCEGCVQSAATCDCVPVVIGEGA